MERFMVSVARFVLSVILLLTFCVVKYEILRENEDYEVFGYTFWGGLVLYSLFYLLIFLFGLILRPMKDSVLSVILSFILLEIILFGFLQSSLIISLFDKKNIELFLLFQFIPLLTMVIHLYFVTLLKRHKC